MNTEAIDMVSHALHELQLTSGITSSFCDQDHLHQSNQEAIVVDLALNGFKVQVQCRYVKHVMPGYSNNPKHYSQDKHPIMLVTGVLPEKVKTHLRERSVGYLDGSGNMFLSFQQIFIWIDGKKSKASLKPKRNKAFTKSGIKLISYLLMNEKLLNLPYREIAEVTGISLGNVNYAINGLAELGYIPLKVRNKMRISNRKKLIEDWAHHYNESLKPSLFKGNFRLADEEKISELQKLKLKKDYTCWGGEPAADTFTNYLRAEAFTMYTSESVADLMKHYSFIPDPDGRITVYEKYWSSYYQVQPDIAPPLIVYADLLGTGDSRCIEVAERVFDEYLSK